MSQPKPITTKDELRMMGIVKRLLELGYGPDAIAAFARHWATTYVNLAHTFPERNDLDRVRERFPAGEVTP